MRTWVQTQKMPPEIVSDYIFMWLSPTLYITSQSQQWVGSCKDRHAKSTELSQKAGSASLAAVPLYRQLLCRLQGKEDNQLLISLQLMSPKWLHSSSLCEGKLTSKGQSNNPVLTTCIPVKPQKQQMITKGERQIISKLWLAASASKVRYKP